MEWLERGTYQLEDQHPPLARVAAAIGLYLSGVRMGKEGSPSEIGTGILLIGGHLDANLALARAGELPFFWIACGVVFIWARRIIGDAGAVISVLLFTHVPAILAHAGLATTDMALTAMLSAAVLSAIFWSEVPTNAHGSLLGITGGLAAISKFSALPLFVCVVAGILIWRVGIQRHVTLHMSHVKSSCLAVLIGGVVIWAAYRFSFGPVWNTGIQLPAPEFFNGLRSVLQHNELGHTAYLFGQVSRSGFWDYYLVDLFVKTPLAFLILAGAGMSAFAGRLQKQYRLGELVAFSLGILAFSMAYSRINIGIRHILPIYSGLAVVAASAFMEIIRIQRWRWAGFALTAWLVASTTAAHPDYLAYFNEAAGAHPENIVIDSDLDWGQDMKQLAVRLRALQVNEFGYLPLVYPELSSVALPAFHEMDIEHAVPGWYAAHISVLKLRENEIRALNPHADFWPERIAPKERIGRGILLWNIPATPATQAGGP